MGPARTAAAQGHDPAEAVRDGRPRSGPSA